MSHNPENIPDSELEKGYRFLDEDEYVPYRVRGLIQFFSNMYGWRPFSASETVVPGITWTFRTNLDKKELAYFRTSSNSKVNQETDIELLEMSVETMKNRIQCLEAALREVLASASPNPRDNPKMFVAWAKARETLG